MAKRIHHQDETKMCSKSSSDNSEETRLPVVRFIETHFVETDAADFKSVVQSFTAQEANPRPHHRAQTETSETSSHAFVNINMPPPPPPPPHSTPEKVVLQARDGVTVAGAEFFKEMDASCMGLETEMLSEEDSKQLLHMEIPHHINVGDTDFLFD
ncbi:hypothetical protein KI387_003651, partial [Taxus chinensis]